MDFAPPAGRGGHNRRARLRFVAVKAAPHFDYSNVSGVITGTDAFTSYKKKSPA